VWKNKQQVPFCNALAVNLVSFDILSVYMQVGGFGARVWGLAAIVGLFGLNLRSNGQHGLEVDLRRTDGWWRWRVRGTRQ